MAKTIKNSFSKADVARNYRDKYGMEMPTLKLARIMYANEKLTFNGVESARSFLRAIEGKSGSNNVKGRIAATHKVPERPRNPYNLPESDEEVFIPYLIRGHKR